MDSKSGSYSEDIFDGRSLRRWYPEYIKWTLGDFQLTADNVQGETWIDGNRIPGIQMEFLKSSITHLDSPFVKL